MLACHGKRQVCLALAHFRNPPDRIEGSSTADRRRTKQTHIPIHWVLRAKLFDRKILHFCSIALYDITHKETISPDMAEPATYLSTKLIESSRKLRNAHRALMSTCNHFDDVHTKISNDNRNLKDRIEELQMRLWKEELLSRLTKNTERKAKLIGRNQESCLTCDKMEEETSRIDELRATERRKLRSTEFVSPVFDVPAMVVNERKPLVPEDLSGTIDTYEETIRRLEESHVLMSREIEDLRDALCLQSAGIDLHIEASGVWTDVEA